MPEYVWLVKNQDGRVLAVFATEKMARNSLRLTYERSGLTPTETVETVEKVELLDRVEHL